MGEQQVLGAGKLLGALLPRELLILGTIVRSIVVNYNTVIIPQEIGVLVTWWTLRDLRGPGPYGSRRGLYKQKGFYIFCSIFLVGRSLVLNLNKVSLPILSNNNRLYYFLISNSAPAFISKTNLPSNHPQVNGSLQIREFLHRFYKRARKQDGHRK